MSLRSRKSGVQDKVINKKRKELVEENREKVVRKKRKAEDEKGKIIIMEKKRRVESENCDALLPYLPEEFIIENILTRSSGVALAKCSIMSKLWHNTIFNDKRFATAHFSQNRNILSLFFNLLNCPTNKKTENAFFFSLEQKKKKKKNREKDVLGFTCRNIVAFPCKNEPVGYCNGLACVKIASEDVGSKGTISVINPTMGETLMITYLSPTGYNPLCHGFGFDSFSQEYKVVLIFTSTTNPEFHCMVFTLGTNSWRSITTSTSEMSPPPGSSPFPSLTRVSRNVCPSASATLANGDLYWRITNQVLEEDGDNKTEMLLSFDLHKEKIELIQLPTEFYLNQRMNEHQYLVADHHQLLEFKGYPCIAHFEKIMNSNSGRSSCCKMHLYILKDKVKQEWIKGETFDVQIKDQEGLLPAGFCCNFDPTTTTTTRVLAFHDHLLLYWFDGECLAFYNLQTKHLEVVRGSRSSYPTLFQTKRKALKASQSAGVGSGDDFFCPYTDYLLDAQVENFRSLKTFIPEGEVSTLNSFDDLKQLVLDKLPAGWMLTGREVSTRKYYAFY